MPYKPLKKLKQPSEELLDRLERIETALGEVLGELRKDYEERGKIISALEIFRKEASEATALLHGYARELKEDYVI